MLVAASLVLEDEFRSLITRHHKINMIHGDKVEKTDSGKLLIRFLHSATV